MSRNRRNRKNAAEARAREQKRRLILGAGLFAVVAAAFLVFAGDIFRPDNTVATSETAARDGRSLGSPDAPVVITAWEDFQCPVCKAANASTLQQVIDNYVETGQVRLEYRYFSFIGQESIWAAEAAEAAAEQGKFWEYHDALFQAQSGENRGAFSKDKLRALARQVGLDMTQFNAAFDSGKYTAVVQDELAAGKKAGVQGTPTFFVDGTKVGDWRDYNQFRTLIDSKLAAAR